MAALYHQEEIRFTAAHRYEQAAFSDEENALTFGPCYNPEGHGHDYRLTVEIEIPSAQDLAAPQRLQSVLWALHDEIDHRHINKVIPRFQNARVVPTTENLARYFHDEIRARAPELKIQRLRLYERPDLYTQITADR